MTRLTALPSDGRVHAHCIRCRRETVKCHRNDGGLTYQCSACNHVAPRALIFDPAIKSWLGPDGEYWHEAAGVFLYNTAGKFLFIKRTRYPFGYNVPVGHVDRGETAAKAARRETSEEANVRLRRGSLIHAATDDVLGDQCRRGSDAHRWHAFVAPMPKGATVKVNPAEGSDPVWLSLDEALRVQLPFVIRHVITRHGKAILRACA